METARSLSAVFGSPNGHLPVEVPNYGRDQLAELFRELGFRSGAEIGVMTAEYSAVLLEKNPELQLYSVDPWSVRPDYRDDRSQEVFDEYERAARERLKPFGARSIICKGLSMGIVNLFNDRSLDFVYIDGHHSFQAVTNDIVEWSKKVRLGGIIAGHDFSQGRYGSDLCVKEVVSAYTRAYRISPWYVLGRSEKVPGEIRDRHRSFLWVNEEILTPAMVRGNA